MYGRAVWFKRVSQASSGFWGKRASHFPLLAVYVASVRLKSSHTSSQGYLDLIRVINLKVLFPCGYYRSYSVPGEGQVHENPEWEKARQALASINKNQSPAKAAQVNRTNAQVFHLKLKVFFFLTSVEVLLRIWCDLESLIVLVFVQASNFFKLTCE